MNRPEQPDLLMPIPDVQSGTDERRLAIDQVGIKGIRFPLAFADRDGVAQPTVALCNVYVALAEDRKGTHMSRLVMLLEERAGPARRRCRSRACARCSTTSSCASMRRPGGSSSRSRTSCARSRRSRGSRACSTTRCGSSGELKDGQYAATVAVAVPVMSLCPASKEISDYGAHNQRSTVTITVRPTQPVFVHELLRIAEEEASCELYGILKRADEKYVTERAYDNPRFVEDLVRGVAARLAADPRFAGFSVEAENFESIHNHSAYARIARGL